MSEQKAETVDAFHFGCGTARICSSLIAGTSTSFWQTKRALPIGKYLWVMGRFNWLLV